jgi:PIN domain nuclease of toxin-antitoxin system
MTLIVIDTHALVWYILEPERLSSRALAAFEATAEIGDLAYLSAISIIQALTNIQTIW